MVSLTTVSRYSPSETVSGAQPGQTTIRPYTYATSKIIRTAVAAGVIVLIVSGLILAFKISSFLRFTQQRHRQRALTTDLAREHRAKAYERAAWADEPGTAPVYTSQAAAAAAAAAASLQAAGLADGRGQYGQGQYGALRAGKRRWFRRETRAGANAYNVKEWEGVAS